MTIQQMGKRAQMNETCRHDNSAPKPITIKIPKLNDITESDASWPRSEDSLQMFKYSIKCEQKIRNYSGISLLGLPNLTNVPANWKVFKLIDVDQWVTKNGNGFHFWAKREIMFTIGILPIGKMFC